MDVDGVSPDGSPVALYLALPAEPDLGRVRSVMGEGCSVLDLGAGVGRLSNPLALLGHRVVAVDNSTEMLDHIRGAVTILADIWSLEAGERFDAVMALSHLINDLSRERRLQLLAVCRRHVHEHGRVIVQRHPPAWVPTEGQGAVGEVSIRLHDLVVEDESFSAATTYTVQGQSWTQRWQAAIVDDAELSTLAQLVGLGIDGVLDEAGAWVLLSPTGSA